METITKTFNIYDYSELSEEAKEKARQWYLDDDFRPQIFSEDVNYWLSENFPDSDLKVQYSLNYCQGDGLNIYGKVRLSEIFEKLNKEIFTEKEYKFLTWALSQYYYRVEIPCNHRYCYCIADRVDFTEEIIQDMEYDGIRDINMAALEKFDSACVEYFQNLCGEYEEAGYKYFYEPDEEEIMETCAANEWKFTEDGEFYC